MENKTNDIILEMRGITKLFPGVRALDQVSFAVERGEIHCLVGENGAGKSTLMKILSGVHPYGSYEGDIIINGEEMRFNRIPDSEAAGVAIIYQELALIPELSIYENIFFGHELMKGRAIDWDRTRHEARRMLERVGLDIDVNTKVKYLGVGQQQLVEIAKVLSRNVTILILDEPTASLNDSDSAHLLNLLRGLKAEGVTSIMISHKLNEVKAIADSISILRDGQMVATFPGKAAEVSTSEIIHLMVGREIKNIYPPRHQNEAGEVIFEVRNWSVEDPTTGREILHDVNFQVRAGEIVGIAGLMGAGRTELALTIFGNPTNFRITSGEVLVHGKPVKLGSPGEAIRNGLAYLTEDRKGNGLILIQDITFNVSLPSLKRLVRGLAIDEDREQKEVGELAEQINIRTPSIRQKVMNLSGGNQQKVSLGKWMYAGPDIMILDEPTRGIDVGAKYEIYVLMNQLAEQGKSVLMISSELPEVLNLSDRVYVLSAGHMTGELARDEFSDVRVMELATLY